MSKKNKSNKESFFKKHSKFSVTLFLFLVAFPLLLVSTIHFYQSVIVKPVLFEDKELKLTKSQNYFDFEVELVEIKGGTENNPKRYVFDYSITELNTTIPKRVKSIEGQLSPKYDKYNSKSVSVGTRLESTSYQKLEITYDHTDNKFPSIRSKLPELYIKIEFSYKSDVTGKDETEIIVVKVNYIISDQLIK